jgi:hypothetical protein
VLLLFILTLLCLTFSTGITSIPMKLKDMCPQFDLWDSWFGLSQKYSPTSIVCSGADGDGSEVADGAEDELQGGAATPDDAVSDTGGDDGRMDDAVEDLEADAEVSSNTRTRPDSSLFLSPEAIHHTESSGLSSPNGNVVPALTSPLSPNGNVAPAPTSPLSPLVVGRGRGRGRSRGQAPLGDAVNATAVVVAQKAALVSAVTSSKVVVSSPSVSSNGSSGKNSFDAVYAEASKNKCEVMKDIEFQRSASAASLQNAEHQFKISERVGQQTFQRSMEMDKQGREHQFLQQQQSIKILADRQESKVQKQIEYDKTLASLLIADKSGALADAFEQRRKREREQEATSDDPVLNILQRFIQSRPES